MPFFTISDENKLESETIAKLINANLKMKLREEAEQLHFLPKTSKNSLYDSKGDSFEVYQKYLSLKQHFNKVDYDYFKFNGKVRANANSFENRKDKHHFVRLSKIYKEEDLTKFFVSNFIKSSDLWIGNLTSPEGRENYISWKSKIQSLPYVFENEVDEILDDYNDFNTLLIVWMVNIHLCSRRYLAEICRLSPSLSWIRFLGSLRSLIRR